MSRRDRSNREIGKPPDVMTQLRLRPRHSPDPLGRICRDGANANSERGRLRQIDENLAEQLLAHPDGRMSPASPKCPGGTGERVSISGLIYVDRVSTSRAGAGLCIPLCQCRPFAESVGPRALTGRASRTSCRHLCSAFGPVASRRLGGPAAFPPDCAIPRACSQRRCRQAIDRSWREPVRLVPPASALCWIWG